LLLAKENAMTTNVVVNLKLDFALLRKQKLELVKMSWKLAEDKKNKRQAELLEGMIHLLDDIQDQSVGQNGLDERAVFGKLSTKG
jgi:hypothetical protein